jgi:Galactose mutarotase and related enzymes
MANIEKIILESFEAYELKSKFLRAVINPEDGFNICLLETYGRTLIPFQKERYEKGMTYGVPVLFPTPNRTRNSEFSFEGANYPAVMHGIIRKEPFQIAGTYMNSESAQISGFIEITPGSRIYQQFPFHCSLELTVTVDEKRLRYHYKVNNLGQHDMPYGFGLHPFFCLEKEKTYVCINAKDLMVRGEDCLPTGELFSVEGTAYDLSYPRSIDMLNLDDVYVSFAGVPQAIIKNGGLTINLIMSEEFSHIVVYTPMTERFFCIEPQTCSTDAINLYNKGETSKSGLFVLKPGEEGSGDIRFEFDYM